MKRNIRWIVSIIAFAVVGMLVGGGINDVLRIKVGEETDRIHSFYDLEKNSIDVLYLGSSHCYHSVQPNVLWGEYGIASYVLGSPGQSVACSYYLLKEALHYQHPRVVMLETYTFRDKKKWRTDARLRQSIDGIRLGKVKAELVSDFFPNLSWKDRMSYYFPFLMSHSRWRDLEDSDFNQISYMKGGVLRFDQAEVEKPVISGKGKEIPDVTKKYLEKIIKLCGEENISLVLFAAPFGKSKAYDKAQPTNLTIEKFAADRGIPFLFYQKTQEVRIDFETDFYDEQHLNSLGAEKISRHMGEWLSQKYAFKDRRKQEGYKDWNDGYEVYLKEFASGKKNVRIMGE